MSLPATLHSCVNGCVMMVANHFYSEISAFWPLYMWEDSFHQLPISDRIIHYFFWFLNIGIDKLQKKITLSCLNFRLKRNIATLSPHFPKQCYGLKSDQFFSRLYLMVIFSITERTYILSFNYDPYLWSNIKFLHTISIFFFLNFTFTFAMIFFFNT